MRARKAIATPEAMSLGSSPHVEIRGRERVRELAEVFTARTEIDDMLGLVSRNFFKY